MAKLDYARIAMQFWMQLGLEANPERCDAMHRHFANPSAVLLKMDSHEE